MPRKARTWIDCINHPAVEGWSDERRSPSDPGDGLWLYLKRPWWNKVQDLSCIHEFTVADCCEQLNDIRQAPEKWD